MLIKKTTSITPKQKEAIKALAIQQGVSHGHIIRKALQQYLDALEKNVEGVSS